MKTMIILPLLALLVVGCSPKPAADPSAGDASVNAAQMRAQIQQQIQSASNAPGCVTTRDANNNVTTQCP
jgi:PBP1b-binding outer membrane lipoprotein LpoB